ncbi:hypothetical protein FOA52_012336 [Chlamydomonas sp. UWO 241]|nr:hypothetical protein FOA52_012336 [Chlamydomonas sp. UWO 241]
MPPGPWGRLVDSISQKLAFFPPRPATYTVEEHKDGSGQLFVAPVDSDNIPRVLQCTVLKLPTKATKKGNHGDVSEVVCAFVPYKSSKTSLNANVTILYSHGNAVDIGPMMPVYMGLSKLLKVNVMGYDYTGYGASAGELPSVGQTFADITAVYEHLVSGIGLSPRNIILYGQSVGSGPTAYLGSVEPDLGGVVLHSPLLSGVRVLSPGLRWWPSFADVYPNHLMVPKINAPTLIMHGTEDEVIHISCARRLHELTKNPVEPLWAGGFNHQNLEMCSEYLPRLRDFVTLVEQRLGEQAKQL